MDELAMFEVLRPDEPGLTDGQRDRLRAAIFGGERRSTAVDGVVTPLFVRRVGRRGSRCGCADRRPGQRPVVEDRRRRGRARRRRRRRHVGARQPARPEAPALAPPSASAVDASLTPAPRVRIDAPGWRLTRVGHRRCRRPRSSCSTPSQRLAGPSIRIDRGDRRLRVVAGERGSARCRSARVGRRRHAVGRR